MIYVTALIGFVGEDEEWREELLVDSRKSAKDEVDAIIAEFNLTEAAKCGEKAKRREARGIVSFAEGEVQYHKWHKVNLVTLDDMTDEWKCDNCGAKKKTRLGMI